MNDSTWLVMDAVGKEGYSRYSDIETYVMERESTLTKTKIRVASEILVNIGLLNKEPIRNPLKGKHPDSKRSFWGSMVDLPPRSGFRHVR